MTLVSWADLLAPAESTVTAMWMRVSMWSWRTSLPMTDWRVSAWTKSISSIALTGSATSQPKSAGTWVESLRATSAPSGLDTPVMRTRRGKLRTKAGDTPRLWIDTPDHRCVGHPLHSQSVRGEAHVDALVHRR